MLKSLCRPGRWCCCSKSTRLIPLDKLKKSSAIKEESDNLEIEEINKILLTNNYNIFDIISCNLIDI